MNDTTKLATQAGGSSTSVTKPGNGQTATRQVRLAPDVDIFEDRHGITLYADLPGVPREKLDVRVQDGSLTIEAEAVVPTRPAYVYSTRRYATRTSRARSR